MDERDVEFEVTHVATGASVTSPLAPEPDTPDAPRHRRIPIRRLIATVTLAVLALVLIATLLPQLAPHLDVTAQYASSTTDIVSHRVYLADGVPWGTLRIDGKRQDLAAGFTPQGLPIAPGRHTLEYVAPPFPPLTCHFSVPAAPSDDCLPSPDQDPLPQAISLEAYPNRLPPDQHAALIGAITHALNDGVASTTIMPGERYNTQDSGIAVASQAMTAQPVYAISGYVNIVNPQYVAGSVPASRYRWQLLVPVQMRYRYTAPGNAVSTSAVLPPDPNSALDRLAVGYDGAWHAEGSSAGITCQVAQDDLQGLMQAIPINQASFSCAPAMNRSDGCLISLTGKYVTQQQQPLSGTALYLYRFGVMLAANDLAHRVVPFLPVIAGQTETNLVRSLVSQVSP